MHDHISLPVQGQPFPSPPEFHPKNPLRFSSARTDDFLRGLRQTPMQGHQLPGGHVITSYQEDGRYRYEVVYRDGEYISGLNSGQASRLVRVLHEIEFGF